MGSPSQIGDPGSQLPYQEFSPYYLAPIWLAFPISLTQVGWSWSLDPPRSFPLLVAPLLITQRRVSKGLLFL